MLTLLVVIRLAAATPFSTTSWRGPDAAFASLVSRHFDEASACWKQRRIPSPGLMRNETMGIIAAQERFWPKHPEYRLRLLAFMLSEGGGLPDGNAHDPSYGVFCVHYDSGRFAADFWGIDAPRGRGAFCDRLRNDSRFCILVGAGELAQKESACGGDWLRAVGMTKYGARRFGEIVTSLGIRPITSLPVMRHYASVLSWVTCLNDYERAGQPGPACACMGRDP